MRIDERSFDELRQVKITPEYTLHAEGCVLVEFGQTRVICTATVEPTLPKWLHGSGKGWVTAEYGMLPRATHSRVKRERTMNSGRTQEISRLIGRSLRAVTKMDQMGEKQIVVDCDVIQADGGTRTASITGGFVALALAFQHLKEKNDISSIPLTEYLSAISVGLQNDNCLLDLCYEEDSAADTDMNFVLTSSEKIVEVQGTAEDTPFDKAQMDAMYEMALRGCQELFEEQQKIIGDFFPIS